VGVHRRANLDAVIYVCRAAIPHITEGGTIVLVSSTAGQRARRSTPITPPRKARYLDYQVPRGRARAKITVNCVAPGWVDTEMSAKPYAGGGRAAIEQTIPLRRVASAEDVAVPFYFSAHRSRGT